MTMRGLVDSLILADSALTDLVPQERWREGSSDNETPLTPFVEYRWGPTTPSVTPRSPVRSCTLTIYVHDKIGSYDRVINPIVDRLKTTLGDAGAVVAEGASLVAADWQDDGEDGYDDGHRTIVRTTRYRIVGTGL